MGALTWKPFRFKTRVWFLKNVPTVCAGCARGCNVFLAAFRNRLHRMTPRVNLDVNTYWMCDAGRQSYAALYERPRLERPMVRFKGEPGEQATLFIRDPSGNALEFKGFRSLEQVFAR